MTVTFAERISIAAMALSAVLLTWQLPMALVGV
jgi:hypothetical protein